MSRSTDAGRPDPGIGGFVVRLARPAEHSDVGEVTFAGFGHAEPGAPQPVPERTRLLRDAASRAAGGELLVAADVGTGELLGTASVLRPWSALARQSREGEAELRLLAVLPKARGRGIGEALTTASIERARAWGAPALVLDTGPANERSQRLYHRLGFERQPARETTPAARGGFLAVFRYDLEASAGVLIRLVRPHEYERVAESLVAAYAQDYEISDHYRAQLQDVAARARSHETWVAVDRADGRLLGSVVTGRPGERITSIGREGELDFRFLGVDPSARRRGVGRALVEHVLALARIRGATRVVLNSGGRMHTAHRLYEAMGFEVLRERVRVFEGGRVSLAYGIDVAA